MNLKHFLRKWKSAADKKDLIIGLAIALTVAVVGISLIIVSTSAKGHISQTLGSEQPPKAINTEEFNNIPPLEATLQSDTYDQLILSDHPVAFWPLSNAGSQVEDATLNGHNGVFNGGQATTTTMPNNDSATVFNGENQYISVPSNSVFSVPATHELTWEGWIKPTTLQFPHASSSGYVEWLGKCVGYSPDCEWSARMYSAVNQQGRCDRLSAYIFNTSAGLGSGADWQPVCGELKAGSWLYVVGEYNETATPAGCNSAYPGSINIWVDGIEWNQPDHAPTGCISEYNVRPSATASPLTIGTVSLDTWFQGGIGKVAIYDYLLSPQQIASHYSAMVGVYPSGFCGVTCTGSF